MQKYTVLLLLMLALTLHAPPAQAATDSGLVAYWNFDGDVLDGKGTNNGTWAGSTTNRYVSGYKGMAGTFTSGNSDYVSVSHNASLQLATNITVSGWVKTSATTGAKLIIAKWTSAGGNRNYWLGILSGSEIAFYVDDTENVRTDISLINDDSWHLVTGVADVANSLLRIYVDGVQKNTAAYDGSSQTGTSDLWIGNSPGSNTQLWDGQIDETRIYNRALSAEEAYQLYSIGRITKAASPKTPAPKGGLIGHWTFDGTVADQVGSNNGTWYGSSTTRYDNDGMIRQSGIFNGTDDYVSITAVNNPLNGLTSTTVSLWFNSTDSGDGLERLISNGINDDFDIGINFSGGTIAGVINNHLGWFIRNTSGTWFDVGAITAGQWTHVVVTASASELKVYINGANTFTQATAWTNGVDGIFNFMRRYNLDSAATVNGKIDDVRIYDRALTAAEIRQLYNQPPPQSGLVGYWNFEGDVSDSSGNSNDGTWSGSTTNRYVSGYRGMAGTFVGANSDYVETGKDITGGLSQLTISAWVNPATLSGNDGIVTHWTSGNLSTLFRAATGALQGYLMTPAQVGGAFNITLTADTWQHVVMTYDGVTLKGYKNGVVGSTTYADTGSIAIGTNTIRIGGGGGSSEGNWDGKMDETRIYNRALSATEVSDLYAYGRVKQVQTSSGAMDSGLVGYWNFDSDVEDVSGNNNAGTWYGSTTNRYVSGYRGMAGTFASANSDYVLTDNSVLLPSTVTYAAWYKVNAFNNWAAVVSNLKHGAPASGFNIVPYSGYIKICEGDGTAGYANQNVTVTGLTTGIWYHVAVTYDGDKFQVYHNGIYKGEWTKVLSQISQKFLMGRWAVSYSSEYFFNGSIDETRIYNRALSATEVSDLYNYGRVKSGDM